MKSKIAKPMLAISAKSAKAPGQISATPQSQWQAAANNSAQVMQLHALAQRANHGPGQVAQRAATGQNHTGLPDQLKAGVEALSGISLDQVRVHYNSSKPEQLQAHAYAQGRDIHLAPGQERHLPHEAWHVVQQAQGRVAASVQAKGVAINDQLHLEAEADQMGARAMQVGTRSQGAMPAMPGMSTMTPTVSSGQPAVTQLLPKWLKRLFGSSDAYSQVGQETLDRAETARVDGRRATAGADTLARTRRADLGHAATGIGISAMEIGLDAAVPGLGYGVSAADTLHSIHQAKKKGKDVKSATGKEMASIAVGFIPVVGEFVGLAEGVVDFTQIAAESDKGRTGRKVEIAQDLLENGPALIEELESIYSDLVEQDQIKAARRVRKAITRLETSMEAAQEWFNKKEDKGTAPLLARGDTMI